MSSNSYEIAWKELQNKVLDEKTSWGKEDLKRRMDKLLIEVLVRSSERGSDAPF